MTSVNIEMDLPEGVDIVSYERHGQGHCFEVTWPFPEHSRCERCRHEETSKFEYKDKVQVVRDLDLWGQPSFWCYPTAFHRCSRCNHRQHILAPFKRKNVTYTYRFEEHVLQMMVGSNETEVAARLGISAETVALIVRNQLQELPQVDGERVITDVGLDEISLKKRHKLYVTILTDLSDPERPRVLAVAKGKDEAAAQKCLECLSAEQRRQVKTCRVDMSVAYHNASERLLPGAKRVVDRFHVAKKFNEAVDAERKKNHQGVQEDLAEETTQGVSVVDVGVSAATGGSQRRGETEVGGSVCQVADAQESV